MNVSVAAVCVKTPEISHGITLNHGYNHCIPASNHDVQRLVMKDSGVYANTKLACLGTVGRHMTHRPCT